MADKEPIVLIIAGGSGTRFFPVSSKERPKQFLKLFNQKTLLENTIDRVLPTVKKENIYICGLEAHKKYFLELGFPEKQLFLEPQGKNTAAAIALSVVSLKTLGFEETSLLWVLPADHYVPDPDPFLKCLKTASKIATEKAGLVTLGILPSSPHTGYGYIEKGSPAAKNENSYEIKAFFEKPTLEKALQYLETGNFYWNAGMFIWTIAAIQEEFQKHCPEIWKVFQNFQKETIKSIYEKIPPLPIDIAIMEKTKKAFVVEGNFRWSDLGSWNSLYEFAPQQQGSHAVFSGNLKSVDSENCLIWSETSRPISLVGVRDLIVVENEKNLLICHRNSDQKIKNLT